MKKLLSVLFVMGLSFLLVACGDSSDEKEKDTSKEETETEEIKKEEPAEVTDDGKELYEVGQTTVVERVTGIKYEVTPTKFEVLTDYNGKNIEEYLSGSIDADRILVITYTVKNIGEKELQPSHDTVIHFDDRENYSGFPMEFRDREKADEMLASGEEIELEQYYTDRIDTKDEFLGAFDFEEEGETWYRYSVSDEAKASLDNTEEDENSEDSTSDNSTENKEAIEFGETATVEKFNGAKFEVTIDNFEISNGNELVVDYTIKNVGETKMIPGSDALLYLGTEEDKGKTMLLTDYEEAEEPLDPGEEMKLQHTYASDDLDENKAYILRAATNDLGDGETKFKTK
ncbi:hypothetical protein GCM10007358_12170 [Phocicoccus schoeneichii]|uniref:DUF4352 domain-containing protein n=1 Tax=Phocicoccus schoeneichii TaxID=1812261 RepID=A0A6V7R923_9BACL|nr:hypothetical protein [Jeotgalicoccus schoeneichii]GGH53129.1 hypothetical protein GCM10007358_12170 [Jeotgalicoccus schoeneichii]CAD2074007.1 hypothetical protein JEOSCH030_00603 [Jeotgalicoccus schoeneichii]